MVMYNTVFGYLVFFYPPSTPFVTPRLVVLEDPRGWAQRTREETHIHAQLQGRQVHVPLPFLSEKEAEKDEKMKLFADLRAYVL